MYELLYGVRLRITFIVKWPLALACESFGFVESGLRRLQIDGCEKVERAHGGCLGRRSRRRTQQAAKSLGEPRAGLEPGISEWGNQEH